MHWSLLIPPENIRKPFHGASKETSGMKCVKFTRVCFIFRNHTQKRLVLHHSFLNMKTREACKCTQNAISYIHACTQNANCMPGVPGKNGSLKLIVRHEWMIIILQYMLYLLKDCYNCFLFSSKTCKWATIYCNV